ncbi:hypothetical protein Tco_0589772, partial [Tanacetum coccineum]
AGPLAGPPALVASILTLSCSAPRAADPMKLTP